ncbi:peptidase [Actinoplanes sp. OR16]|uniref:S8 family peptidase n=1 Tax=Actinoplanes sp. OR16 TaxID=946334 RepID=UPI000F709333|nr:S8 family serine peptidase [Actinoplanes sp. OR16]BBH71822.1 peptidase [Actinoplanes sp. OR16]
MPLPHARRARRRLALALAGLTLLSTMPATPAVAAGAVPATRAVPGGAVPATRAVPGGAAPAAAGASHTVTLITGDRVTVTEVGGGRYATDVKRPDGARGGVHAQTIGDDFYVIPDEALPYLADDRVDRRLFNVSMLIRDGYDDRHADSTPLIVGYTRSAGPVPAGTVKKRALPSVRGQAVEAAKREARRTWEDVTASAGIAKVWLDGKVRTDLVESTAQIGAPAAWAAGLDGKGVKVAVLDTGADLDHPDLAGRVSTATSFVPGESAEDGHGHGTHTASTVAGSGAESGGTEKGVAPEADLIIGKVLSDEGSGDDSWVIAGMEWAAAQGARVVSMSLGGDMPSDGTDPMSAAVNRLTAQTGALFVIAAGNVGAEASISSPGAADAALTVAAVDSADQRAYFSSAGPRFGDYGLKPDIAAPGVDIVAAKAGGGYEAMSGTSMATPHVAGAAAILAGQHPQWRAQELKNALMSSAAAVSGTAYEIGAGRVDVKAGITSSITATGSVYFGFVGWPHPSPAPISREVTYSNSGDVPVTLDLGVSGSVAGGPYDTDPGADAGTPAPGMFTLSASTVVVPAQGTASVTVTAHPEQAADGRRYLGEIKAGGVRTQLGLYAEDERHDLTLDVKDRAGAAASGYLLLQRFGEIDPEIVAYDGKTTLRLRSGVYSGVTYLQTSGSHGPDSIGMTQLGAPEIVLDRDRTVVLDARQAREATATVPKVTQDRALYLNWHRTDGDTSVFTDQYLLPPWVDTMYALPTAPVTRGSFEFETRWRKSRPLLTVSGVEDFLGQPGSSLYDGTARLETIYLPTGSISDYSGRDVRGKVVIVTRSAGLTGSERAANAAAAGAALLMVVNDGPGKLHEWVGKDDGTSVPIPVLGLTARVGQALISRMGRLTVTGSPNSPYVYDLVDPHPGRVPSSLAYRPKASELAVVDMRYHGSGKRRGGEFRWDYRPYRPYSVGYEMALDFPSTRTDYVSAQPGTAWAEDAVGGANLELVSVSETHTYKPGSRQTVNFFGPVIRPRNNAPFWSSTRYQGYMAFNVQPWADGGHGHAGYQQWGDTLRFTVSRDGSLLKESEWAMAALEEDPAGASKYTLDLKAGRDPSAYPFSPATHTVWDVVSRPAVADEETMPLLQLDYGVVTDLAGYARGGRQSLTLTPSHLPGAVGAGRITTATLDVSFDDGATWKKASLRRSGSGWAATFPAPLSGFVTLRATARDTAGNTIRQEITRAYGIRS